MTPNERYKQIKDEHHWGTEDAHDPIVCAICQMIEWYEALLDQQSKFRSMMFLAAKEGKIYLGELREPGEAENEGTDLYIVSQDHLKS